MGVVEILLLVIAGCVAGYLAGFFGVGGGIILVPVLLIYFQSIGVTSLVATHLAFGTSLLVVLFTSLGSSYRYFKNGLVVGRAVAIMGLASVAGAYAGSGIAAGLEGPTLQKIFACVVMIAAVRLLNDPRKGGTDAEPDLTAWRLIVTGAVVGVISSVAGVGGGIFSIPIMFTFLHFPLKKALGTSSATIVITAAAAAAGYMLRGWGNPLLPPWTLGYVDFLHALPLVAGAVPFSMIGATSAKKTKPDALRKIYAVFLIVIAVKMFFF